MARSLLLAAVVAVACLSALASAATNLGTGCGTCTLAAFKGATGNNTLYGSLDEDLVASKAMDALYQSQCVSIPYVTFTMLFAQPQHWCMWNALFGPVNNRYLHAGEALNASFNILPDVKWESGTQLLPPSIRLANTDYYAQGASEYGWTYNFTSASGTVLEYGRHNYGMGYLTENTTCLVSWEKAAGSYAETYSTEIHKTLDCVTSSAMDGARCLEYVYAVTGRLDSVAVAKYCHEYTGYGCEKTTEDATDCLPDGTGFPKDGKPAPSAGAAAAAPAPGTHRITQVRVN